LNFQFSKTQQVLCFSLHKKDLMILLRVVNLNQERITMPEKSKAPFNQNDKVVPTSLPVESMNTGRGGAVLYKQRLTVKKVKKDVKNRWSLVFKEKEGSYPADMFKLSQLSN